ncbi:MAG: tryptophan synthase subunit alpha [Pseudonocardia sp.]|nr:tryptophan synthase subunit alpha [Pseudonocardia sp.]
MICYLPLGDPAASVASVSCYVEHGVDVVEAGIPVVAPPLDGPEVEESMVRALAAGLDTGRAAALLGRECAAAEASYTVWMSYREHLDEWYLARVSDSGASAILLPDADPVALNQQVATMAALDVVPFLGHPPSAAQVCAATLADARYAMLAAAAGRTGERATVDETNRALLSRLREQGVRIPIALGFGISGPEHARTAIELGADGVVVGSACIRAARAGLRPLRTLLDGLRRAIDGRE